VKKNRVGNVIVLPQDARAAQGVWLLLGSLSIFFVSSILLYVVYIAMRIAPDSGMKPHSFFLPKSFLPSTLLLVGVSGALEWALRSARRDRVQEVKRATLSAFIMGMLFMAIQSEGMYRLIYAANQASSLRNSAYALTFVLALLHALHVVGGIVGLVSILFNANREKYDHERHFGLRFCTLYWHFLDIVWVLLLASFFISVALINQKPSSDGILRERASDRLEMTRD
jgi:cytochrome c oxidase subunit 3